MTDLLSAEDIKKAIGAFAGEQCTPPPHLALSPRPFPAPGGTPLIPLRSLLSFSRPRIGPHPQGWLLGPFPSKTCTGCTPCPSHTKLRGSEGWPFPGGLAGSRAKREDQGGKKEGARLPL